MCFPKCVLVFEKHNCVLGKHNCVFVKLTRTELDDLIRGVAADSGAPHRQRSASDSPPVIRRPGSPPPPVRSCRWAVAGWSSPTGRAGDRSNHANEVIEFGDCDFVPKHNCVCFRKTQLCFRKTQLCFGKTQLLGFYGRFMDEFNREG